MKTPVDLVFIVRNENDLVSWAALQGDGEGEGRASAHQEAAGGVILVGRHGRWVLAWQVPSGIFVSLLRGDEAFRNGWSLKEVHSDWGGQSAHPPWQLSDQKTDPRPSLG